jgi:toxin FitB
MILLDTDVLSEPLRRQPHPSVLAWLDEQVAETLFVSTVTQAEMAFGVACMPEGRRRESLEAAVQASMDAFEGRILAFDAAAARRYGALAARARAAGQGLPLPDGYIAAIAAAHGFIVASRDVAPYRAAGIEVIDPFAG